MEEEHCYMCRVRKESASAIDLPSYDNRVEVVGLIISTEVRDKKSWAEAR